MTTESNVLYTQAANPNAGAVPQLTNVATHERASDGADVDDDDLFLATWYMFLSHVYTKEK